MPQFLGKYVFAFFLRKFGLYGRSKFKKPISRITLGWNGKETLKLCFYLYLSEALSSLYSIFHKPGPKLDSEEAENIGDLHEWSV